MLPVVRVGLLFVLTAGREVLRFGVNVALGLRAVPVVEGRFKLFWFKWPVFCRICRFEACLKTCLRPFLRGDR